MRREWQWMLVAAIALSLGTLGAEAYARLLTPYYVGVSRLIARAYPWTIAAIDIGTSSRGPGKALRLTGFFRESAADNAPAGEIDAELQIAAVMETPVVFWTVLALWPLGGAGLRRRLEVLLVGVPVFLGLEAATTVCQLLSPLAYGSAVLAGDPQPSTWWDGWSRFIENGGRIALALVGATLAVSLGSMGPERRRERLADENALTGHQDTLPVSLQQGLAGEVVGENHLDVGELGGEITGFNHGAVAPGGTSIEPAQTAHLWAIGQHATVGCQVVGDRAGQKPIGGEIRDAARPDEIEQNILTVADAVVVEDFDLHPRSCERAGGPVCAGPGVTLRVIGGEQIGRAVRVGVIGMDAALDQGSGMSEVRRRNAHGRTDP